MLTLSIGILIIYPIVRKTIERNIESELNNTSRTILNMVKTGVHVSIENYLRAVAEQDKYILEGLYEQYMRGEISEGDAKKRAISMLLSQHIGKSGYVYCIDSGGAIRVHPVAALVGTRNTQYVFVREQLKRKEGYMEYEWANPGEARARPKALYMTYFGPWDWIISVSAYREEFLSLLDVKDFREGIIGIRIGKTGYPFVVDSKGNMIIHPLLEGRNFFNLKDASGRAFVQELCKQKNGRIIYPWRNPGEKNLRYKLVFFNYIPELDWIVAASAYVDEIYAPLAYIRNTLIVMFVTSLIFLFFLTFWYGSYIINSLNRLIAGFKAGSAGDFSARISDTPEDEFGKLSRYFNGFMEKLDAYNQSLQREIEEKGQVLQSLQKSEMEYHTLVDNINVGIFRSPAGGGHFIRVNPALAHMHGYESADQMLAVKVEEMWRNPEDRQGYIDELRRDGYVNNKVIAMKKKDGKTIWCSMTATAAYDENGELKWIDGINEDITEHKEAEAAMYQLAAIMDNSMDGIVISDDNGIIVNANKQAYSMYETDSSELIGQRMRLFRSEKDGSAWTEQLQRLQRGETLLFETRYYSQEGSFRFIEISAKSMLIDQKVYIQAFHRDITERKKMLAQLIHAQKMESIGTLAGGIAHDFGNILTTVSLYADLISSSEGTSSDIDQYASIVKSSAERGKHFVTQLLAYAKREYGDFVQVSANDVIRKTMGLVSTLIPKNIRINQYLDESLPPVDGDESKLEQIIMNLVLNSIDAMPEGGEINISTRVVELGHGSLQIPAQISSGRYVNVTCSDTGKGIPKDYMAHIFDPFYTTKKTGTGLGLAIVYGLVKDHGGYVIVTSAPGQGTTFNIFLPVSKNARGGIA